MQRQSGNTEASAELYSTFYRLLRMNEITDNTLRSVIKSFENDCKFRFLVKPIESNIFKKAKEIIAKYGSEKSLRTLDAIQLSVFLNIGDVVFVSADALLLEYARDENLEALKAG